MNKEDILAASRKENQNTDLAEMELLKYAGNLAGRVGAAVCFLLSVIARLLTGEYILSPWIIYFSIVSAHWLARSIKTRKLSDLAVGLLFLFIFAVLFILFITELLKNRI